MEVGFQPLAPRAPLDYLGVEGVGYMLRSSFLGAPQDVWLPLVAPIRGLLLRAYGGCALARGACLRVEHVELQVLVPHGIVVLVGELRRLALLGVGVVELALG